MLIVNGEQRDWTPVIPTPDNYDPDDPETWEPVDYDEVFAEAASDYADIQAGRL